MKKKIRTFTDLRNIIENEPITVDFLREWKDFVGWDNNFWDLWPLICKEKEVFVNLDVMREFREYIDWISLFFGNSYLFDNKELRDKAMNEFWEDIDQAQVEAKQYWGSRIK